MCHIPHPAHPEQLELPTQAPEDLTDVLWLERWLLEHPGWHTAAEIARAVEDRITDRAVRELASQSAWILSAPGSPGYIHLKHSTAEQTDHYINAGRSQAVQMLKRYLRLRRSAHALLG